MLRPRFVFMLILRMPQLVHNRTYLCARKLLKKLWQASDADVCKVNEAFAVVAVAFIRELEIDPEHVNIHGGLVRWGIPSTFAARILVSLLNALKQSGGSKGLAAICHGGEGSRCSGGSMKLDENIAAIVSGVSGLGAAVRHLRDREVKTAYLTRMKMQAIKRL